MTLKQSGKGGRRCLMCRCAVCGKPGCIVRQVPAPIPLSDAYCDDCASSYMDFLYPREIRLGNTPCPKCGANKWETDDNKTTTCKNCGAVATIVAATRHEESEIYMLECSDEPNQPTEEGKRRYEGGFYEGYACICESCPIDCRGECGCEACSAAYSDFLSCE